MRYQPLIIIGAPRSGTNMLRDVLTALDGVSTWPCDEINYIWRHRNVRYPSDALPVERATPAVRAYVARRFDWVARRHDAEVVVEKTCANSLRVPFVDAVMPQARYLFIRRDGVDAVGSAMSRWKASLDIGYLAEKARFVPAMDLPYYGGRYIWSRLYRLFSSEQRVAFWGPRLDDMEALQREYSLAEVCAIQWQRCVDSAAAAFAGMPEQRWLEIGYEDFVRHPEQALERILGFLDRDVPKERQRAVVENVRSTSIGKGRAALDDATIRQLETLVGDTQRRYGYL
ncbi:sulfotransferase family protein [Salinisphaera aquimarina]|uniref:Sulfotransferase family protein n=1 Tax=Salinisphaera aquimarina TaxID=2094031 RepID=A0ABV7EVY5_9GAMM